MVSEKSLRRWTNAELERVRKVWAVVGFWSGLESYGSGFVARWWSRFRAGEAVALWSVSGAERAAGGARLSEVYLGDSGGCSGRFEIPRSRRAGRQQSRALRDFAALVPWRSRVESRALFARTVTRKSSLRRDARRSHLMHQMNQGFILSDSQKEIALKG